MREIKFRAYFKDGGHIDVNLYGQNPPLQRNVFLAVTQFTGLLDKNGVEIYEGDVVKVHSYTVTGLGKVGFNKGSFVFNKFEYPTSQVLHSFSEIEVIGNIYEHPHLLGGE